MTSTTTVSFYGFYLRPLDRLPLFLPLQHRLVEVEQTLLKLLLRVAAEDRRTTGAEEHRLLPAVIHDAAVTPQPVSPLLMPVLATTSSRIVVAAANRGALVRLRFWCRPLFPPGEIVPVWGHSQQPMQPRKGASLPDPDKKLLHLVISLLPLANYIAAYI